jgi:hypothetical protein
MIVLSITRCSTIRFLTQLLGSIDLMKTAASNGSLKGDFGDRFRKSYQHLKRLRNGRNAS